MEATTEIKERPILFSGPMVRAILDGKKTQTRRVISYNYVDFIGAGGKDGPEWNDPGHWGYEGADLKWYTLKAQGPPDPTNEIPCRYGKPGDRLWVRETWCPRSDGCLHDQFGTPRYRATDELKPEWGFKWRPSIHMPRWASRINLKVTDVRVERFQEIAHFDIRKEGFDCPVHDFPGGMCVSECLQLRAWFYKSWDEINGKRGFGWEVNPWVWVVEFELER